MCAALAPNRAAICGYPRRPLPKRYMLDTIIIQTRKDTSANTKLDYEGTSFGRLYNKIREREAIENDLTAAHLVITLSQMKSVHLRFTLFQNIW